MGEAGLTNQVCHNLAWWLGSKRAEKAAAAAAAAAVNIVIHPAHSARHEWSLRGVGNGPGGGVGHGMWRWRGIGRAAPRQVRVFVGLSVTKRSRESGGRDETRVPKTKGVTVVRPMSARHALDGGRRRAAAVAAAHWRRSRANCTSGAATHAGGLPPGEELQRACRHRPRWWGTVAWVQP